MNELTHLDLFSGIGGFALAASWAGFRTVGFSEIEPYCCGVLEKNFPSVRNYGDISTADFSAIGDIRLLTGGYPCQPFSSAGKRRGEGDDRHLWPAMFDVIKKVRPTWVVAENVAGHISMGLDQVLSDLEGVGYSTQPIVIPACAFGARHRRDRVWICADSHSERQSRPRDDQRSMRSTADENGEANSSFANGGGITESQLGGMADGLPCGLDGHGGWASGTPIPPTSKSEGRASRAHRLKSLGNAIVPQVAYQILKAIAEIERAV